MHTRTEAREPATPDQTLLVLLAQAGDRAALEQVRLAPDAEEYLHSIWLYVATEAASIDIADRVIGRVLGRLPLLATPLSWP